MVGVRELLRRIPRPGTSSRRRIEREIREEIQTHIDLRTADSVAAGMSPAAARRDAEQRFGDPERIVRSGRAIRSAASSGAPLGTFPFRPSQSPRPELMRDLIHDLKLAARGLIHNPGFAAVAILSLALGIGFNTTMFAVIDAVLFKPIPVADSGSLVRLRKVSTVDRGPLDDIIGMMMSYPDYLDIRDQAEVFSGIAAYRNEMTGFNNRGSAEFLFGESVTASYFDVLGIRPLVGRSFAPDEDDDPGGNFVFMVAEAVWRGRNFYTVARLRDGATIEQANARVAAIGRALVAEYPESHEGIELSALPANDVRIAPSVDRMSSQRLRGALVVVQVAVSLVLLIGAALLMRSLANASRIDPGIATEAIVSVNLALIFQGYDANKLLFSTRRRWSASRPCRASMPSLLPSGCRLNRPP